MDAKDSTQSLIGYKCRIVKVVYHSMISEDYHFIYLFFGKIFDYLFHM